MIVLLLGVALAAENVYVRDSNDLFDELQGNNWNPYIVYLYQADSSDDQTRKATKEIQKQLDDLLIDESSFKFVKINEKDSDFSEVFTKL